MPFLSELGRRPLCAREYAHGFLNCLNTANPLLGGTNTLPLQVNSPFHVLAQPPISLIAGYFPCHMPSI